MIDMVKVLDIVLLNSNEESGLWEVLDELVQLYPDTRREEGLSILRDCIYRLLEEELVMLYELPEPYNKTRDIPLQESREILYKDNSWKPEQSTHLVATDKGEAIFRSKDYSRFL